MMTAEAYFNRGRVYFAEGEIDKAIADYNKAIELNPIYEDAYYKRMMYPKINGIRYEWHGVGSTNE